VGRYIHVQQVPRAYLPLTWTEPTYSQQDINSTENVLVSVIALLMNIRARQTQNVRVRVNSAYAGRIEGLN
jgi:RecB family endonuclease NucS